MGAVIPVRLDDEDIRRIDKLVKRQSYRSRNEAIRRMLKAKLSEEEIEHDDDEDVERLVRLLLKRKKAGEEPVSFKSRKSSVEVIAEGRDRWPT